MEPLVDITVNPRRDPKWQSAKSGVSACRLCGSPCERTYCSIACYRAIQRSGNASDRFWSKVTKGASCWEWTASRTGSLGYGHFSYQIAAGKQGHIYAHRWAWEQANGDIPDGLSVLHHCDNPICVNPAHLFLGTQDDNMKDAARKGRLSVPRPRRQRITDDEIAEMIRLAACGVKQVRIAERFRVSKAFVSCVLKGKRRQLRKRTEVAA